MTDPTRTESLDVLVVDDSPTYRMILTRALKGWPRANLVATAGDGQAALDAIVGKKPHLMLLDVSMPVLDGIETLRRSRQRHDDVDVVMFSGLDENQTALTMQALSLGALDFVPKPQGDNPAESFATLTSNLFPLLELAWSRRRRRLARQEAAKAAAAPRQMLVIAPQSPAASPASAPSAPSTAPKATSAAPPAEPKPQPARTPAPTAQPTPKPAAAPARTVPPVSDRKPPRHPELLVVGVSTGGPNALHNLIPKIPARFPVPILCVQHMPPLFTASLAERLDRESEIDVVEGAEGMIPAPGRMYIAPGGTHMVAVRAADGKLRLTMRNDPPVHSCRPSVDVLFRSVAELGVPVVSVVLTGMGSDGADGVKDLRAKGGWSVIQDEASSVVWGMPGAVHAAGQADETLPLDAIAGRLSELFGAKGGRP